MKHKKVFFVFAFIFVSNAVLAELPASLELSSLNGENGFILTGEQNTDFFGIEVNGLGDINNDGFDDFLVSAPGADLAYVIYGKNTPFTTPISAADINGTNGFVIQGRKGDRLSASNSSGDFNGDGINDIIIGGDGVGSQLSNPGVAYVIFGSDTNFSSVFDVTSLNGVNGFAIYGINDAENLTGLSSLSFVSDFNGDIFNDLVLGAPGVNENDVGKVYLIFGTDVNLGSVFDLSTLNGSNGFVIENNQGNKKIGTFVREIGDINADGYGDFSFSQRPREEFGSGFLSDAFVMYGSYQMISSPLNINSFDGTYGFKIIGIDYVDTDSTNDCIVDGVGDFNDDGIDDFGLGVVEADVNGPNSGVAYIVYGSDQGFPGEYDLASLNGSNGFKLNAPSEYYWLGRKVNSIGDVNNDGITDLQISSANSVNPGANFITSWILYGSTQQMPSSISESYLDGSNGIVVKSYSGQVGAAMISSSHGDVNGDSVSDVIYGFGNINTPNGYLPAVMVVYGDGDIIFRNSFETD